MRILLANKFYYRRGGDCIHTLGLQGLLEKEGHEVAVFSMDHPENLENDYCTFWPSTLAFDKKKPGKIREALLRPIYSKEVKHKWNALLDDFQPDVVHLHNIHTQLSPIIAMESHKRQIPVYWTLHDYKLICPSYAMLHEGQVCEECFSDPKSVIRNRCIKGSFAGSVIGYLEARQWNRQKLEQYTVRFIAPSRFMQAKMTEAGYSLNRFKQLYNFTDSEKFKPVTEKADYYVYLGRFAEEKGVETLLKAASRHPEYHLKLIGDGPLREQLEQKYAASHIKFLGYQNWESIQKLLGHACFMVIPSEWYENNPLSIIEAFALGTPVLGARIGGIPELINPTNGMLFESGQVDSLNIALDEMMQKKDWNYTQISAGAAEKFSAKNYYQQLMELYQQQ